MKKLNISVGVLLFFALMLSCEKKEEAEINETKNYTISGTIQKGPFVNGSELTVYELSSTLSQTGRSFHTSTNKQGKFSLEDISLTTPYVELVANGFYYNEVTGDLSGESLTLKAIVDLSDQSTVNVNVLTDLEFARVKELISSQSLSLSDAKLQARNECLEIFSLEEYQIGNSESLNILEDTEGDAILLALSAILQGNHSVAELSKLLADMEEDIKLDGILNDTLIQNDLLGQAYTLNVSDINANLLSIFEEMEIELDAVNDFGEYVDHFLIHSNYEIATPFSFPASTSNGINILDTTITDFPIFTKCAFAVDMPKSGEIKIVMKRISGTGNWGYYAFQTSGWQISQYNFNAHEQTFTSIVNDRLIDVPVEFTEYGTASIEYYYNKSTSPAITKTISWGEENNTAYEFPYDSPMGPNLLNFSDGEIITSDTCIVGLKKPGTWTESFTLAASEGLTMDTLLGWGKYQYYDVRSDTIVFSLLSPDHDNSSSEVPVIFTGSGEVRLTSTTLENEAEPLARTFYFE